MLEKSKIIIRTDAELEPLMPGFLANRQRDVQNIRAALANADFETISRLAHSMKGIGAAYGFDYITTVGGQLEQAAHLQQIEAISDYVFELADYLGRVEIIYEA